MWWCNVSHPEADCCPITAWSWSDSFLLQNSNLPNSCCVLFIKELFICLKLHLWIICQTRYQWLYVYIYNNLRLFGVSDRISFCSHSDGNILISTAVIENESSSWDQSDFFIHQRSHQSSSKTPKCVWFLRSASTAYISASSPCVWCTYTDVECFTPSERQSFLNLFNLIQSIRGRKSAIKSAQVTVRGESNYFYKKKEEEEKSNTGRPIKPSYRKSLFVILLSCLE